MAMANANVNIGSGANASTGLGAGTTVAGTGVGTTAVTGAGTTAGTGVGTGNLVVDSKTQAKHQGHKHEPHVGTWTHGLCGCFADCKICCTSFICPCWQYGRNKEHSEGKRCFPECLAYFALIFCGLWWVVQSRNREDIRLKYGIAGTPLRDCCIDCWCPWCALAQEGHEIKDREIHQRP